MHLLATSFNFVLASHVIQYSSRLKLFCIFGVQSLPLEQEKKTTFAVAIGASIAVALVSLLIGLFLE